MTDAPPRFLADECCDFGVVRALRAQGYDVKCVSEQATRSEDTGVISMAHQEGRVLLTEDKDFGWLVFVSGAASPGVVLIRCPGNARSGLGSSVVEFIQKHSGAVRGAFVVVEPGLVRITRRPTS